MRWVLLVAVASACVVPQPRTRTIRPLTAEEIADDREARARLEAERLEAREEERRYNERVREMNERAKADAAQKEHEAATRGQREAEMVEKAAAWREQVERERREAEEEAKNDPIRLWLDAHCKLEQPPTRYVQRCEPVCWEEEIVPCPEYRCRQKPPVDDWVERANRSMCGGRAKARRVTGELVPRPTITSE
jgi:hypothetical protein